MGKIVVACIGSGILGHCGVGANEDYFRAFEFYENAYYTVECIEQITVDNYDDEKFVISGEVGNIEYDKDIPLENAAIHYIVSCDLKRNRKKRSEE